jgi:hypothetical protein
LPGAAHPCRRSRPAESCTAQFNLKSSLRSAASARASGGQPTPCPRQLPLVEAQKSFASPRRTDLRDVCPSTTLGCVLAVRPHMARGQHGSVLLSCMPLSFTTSRPLLHVGLSRRYPARIGRSTPGISPSPSRFAASRTLPHPFAPRPKNLKQVLDFRLFRDFLDGVAPSPQPYKLLN